MRREGVSRYIRSVELYDLLRVTAILLSIFMGTIWGLKSTFLVPIPFPVAISGFHFLDRMYLAETLMVVALVLSLFALRRKSGPWILILCGVAHLFASLSTAVHRPAFNLCVPLILIFLGLSEIAKSVGPILVLNVSIYLLSGLEKFVRYKDTLTVLKVRYGGFASPEFINTFPDFFWTAIDWMAVLAGPGELLIGGLLLVPRFRRVGLFMALGFHWILAFMSSGRFIFLMVGIIVPVSLCLYQTFESGKKISDLFPHSPRLRKPVAGGWIILIALSFFDLHPVLRALVLSAAVALPFVAVILSMPYPNSSRFVLSLKQRATSVAIFLASFWGALPFLVEFRTLHLGFALFTANQWDLPIYRFDADMQKCEYQTLNPVIRTISTGERVVFYAFDETALELWQSRVRQRCSEASPSAIEKRPANENPLRLRDDF